MSPRTKEQFANIRKERKLQIIEAALEVFAQNGFHKASISEIAKEAGISKGLLYNYFQDKEELLIEVMSGGITYLLRAFTIETNESAASQLKKMILKGFDLMDEDEKHWRLYFSAMMQPDVQQLVMAKLMESLLPVFDNLAKIFGKMGFENPFHEARIFGAVLDGLGLNYMLDAETFPKEYCIKRLYEIYELKETD
jgi:AcrR family transcriptional regulator